MQLVEMGYQNGDRFASALPLSTEHILIEYACFRIGVIFVPLDLRLSPAEMIRNLGLLRPRGFAFLGAELQHVPAAGDFSLLGKMVETEAPFVEHRLCFLDGDAATALENSGNGLLTMRQMLARVSELASGEAASAKRVREAFERALDAELRAHRIDFVCLAGFMRLLTPWFVTRWSGRMLNIHPALLPQFKGLDTHRRALETGVKQHGATVHFVVPEVDAGPIVAQGVVTVREDDTEATLAARVLEVEHRIYPQALRALAEGRASLTASSRGENSPGESRA